MSACSITPALLSADKAALAIETKFAAAAMAASILAGRSVAERPQLPIPVGARLSYQLGRRVSPHILLAVLVAKSFVYLEGVARSQRGGIGRLNRSMSHCQIARGEMCRGDNGLRGFAVIMLGAGGLGKSWNFGVGGVTVGVRIT
ncbi:hypothetical protein BN1708_000596 [Verticillium longisporum]|uniref:Uncharacterized protein n=1 Tax=Verticillium longisporum TaxID=100787 RepID=A0A0G4LXP3_VERLO|nr:hypothetical protein BN1708_000596 [Verticillium longisporum]